MLLFTSHLLSCQRDSLLSERVCSLDYFCLTSKDPSPRHCMRIIRGFGYYIVCARVRLTSASCQYSFVADPRISPAGDGFEVPENSRCFSIRPARAFRNRQRWGYLSHTRSWQRSDYCGRQSYADCSEYNLPPYQLPTLRPSWLGGALRHVSAAPSDYRLATLQEWSISVPSSEGRSALRVLNGL